jgi:hypothetical protein
MDEFMTLRRLNIRIQGFPESYATEPYMMAEDNVAGEARDVTYDSSMMVAGSGGPPLVAIPHDSQIDVSGMHGDSHPNEQHHPHASPRGSPRASPANKSVGIGDGPLNGTSVEEAAEAAAATVL